MKKKKLLICDVDGTLVNSNAGFGLAIAELMKSEFDVKVKSEMIASMSGLPLREIIENFVGKIDSGKYHSVAKMYRDIYNSKYIHQIDLFPEVKESLAILSNNCYLSTVTNLPTKQTKLLFEKFELTDFFDKIRGTDINDNPKPSPDLLNEAIEEFGVTREFAFMIGDSFNDIKAGKNAKVKTIAISYQNSISHAIQSLSPEVTINKFSQVIEIIERY